MTVKSKEGKGELVALEVVLLEVKDKVEKTSFKRRVSKVHATLIAQERLSESVGGQLRPICHFREVIPLLVDTEVMLFGL